MTTIEVISWGWPKAYAWPIAPRSSCTRLPPPVACDASSSEFLLSPGFVSCLREDYRNAAGPSGRLLTRGDEDASAMLDLRRMLMTEHRRAIATIGQTVLVKRDDCGSLKSEAKRS